ncbi:TIGR03943 family protein [Sedimentibacter hydroxybenzoicus DSM 7310]|uniref:TIGR03943 family protein n=1 Tax=Sedimentibacter hydroxybenzoicus DSM 7310 TaxID=1123245 RepID=A0A974BNA2_SEDHY|nr:TIGR03943 family protein [Sedimentibacter hydroxybenzoicus]NYB75815.1 TIGR03943 family protein [Sedimentibacter hydroxybenzoicus DSM 7310]
MQAKAFNFQVFLEISCNIVFALIIIYLLKSGNYLYYVTPRMEPYLIFSTIVSAIWALAGIKRLFKPQHLIRSAHCFVLMIPVVLLLLPHSALGINDVSTGYAGAGAYMKNPTSGNSSIQSEYSSGQYSDFTNDPVDYSGNTTSPSAQEDYNYSYDISPSPYEPDVKSGLDEENKKINIINDEFYPWITEIYANMDGYEGYEITMTGFVFKDQEYLNENEFVPARLAMVCCAADLAPIGILCLYDNLSELESGQWVTVTGILHKGQYNGQDEPQITVTGISPAEEVLVYIFPY